MLILNSKEVFIDYNPKSNEEGNLQFTIIKDGQLHRINYLISVEKTPTNACGSECYKWETSGEYYQISNLSYSCIHSVLGMINDLGYEINIPFSVIVERIVKCYISYLEFPPLDVSMQKETADKNIDFGDDLMPQKELPQQTGERFYTSQQSFSSDGISILIDGVGDVPESKLESFFAAAKEGLDCRANN